MAEHSRPPPELLAELEEVAEAARDLLEAFRSVNELPEGCPKNLIVEIATALIRLPNGTAEGAREPLRYAHERFGKIRLLCRARAADDEPAPFARRGRIDALGAALYLAVGTARHGLAALDGETLDEELLEPIEGPNPKEIAVQTALEAGIEAERALDQTGKTLAELVDTSKEAADAAIRQVSDATTVTKLTIAELRLKDVNRAWRRRLASLLKTSPRRIAKALRKLGKGVEVAEAHWKDFEAFRKNPVGGTLSAMRNAVYLAAGKLESLEPPEDFDIDEAHRLVLSGTEPPESWRPWITDLNLVWPEMVDLRPLSRLVKLRLLWLESAKLSDLTPIADLAGLQMLWIYCPQVYDVAPLARLANLQTLSLDGSQVTDLRPISRLPNINQLWLNRTRVTDLAPLASLEKLLTLSLNGTVVNDLAPIAHLRNLFELSLNDTNVADLAPIEHFGDLRMLFLRNTRVSDLTPVTRLEKIEMLSLNGTEVQDLTALRNLKKLRVLGLAGTHVDDLAPISGLEDLEELWLNNTQVRDLAQISHLTHLARIYVESESRRSSLASTLAHHKEVIVAEFPTD